MPEVSETVYRGGFAPDPSLVKVLEELLEHAKEGRLRSLSYAAVLADGMKEAGFTQWHIAVSPMTQYAMSHALLMLFTDWQAFCRQRAIEANTKAAGEAQH